VRVALATHQATAVLRGGPRTQLLQTASGLRLLGVDVGFLDNVTQLRKEDVDLVHIFGAGIATFHLARALHQQRIPTVVSPIYLTRRSPAVVRTMIAAERIAGKLYRGLFSEYGMVAQMCEWAVCVAPNTEEEAALCRNAFGVPSEKIAVVPNGVEERFRTATPDAFVAAYGMRDFVLNVGHIGPARKNVMRLVEAMGRIDRPAVIIGRIEQSPEGRAIVERAFRNPRIRILDHIDHDSEMLASAYAACSVFALPSQFETPGIAALEAGLAGANIVITPYGGTREYFGEMAEYVDPYSISDIRRGIEKAVSRSRTRGLSDHIASHFLWPHAARRTVEVYEKTLRS